MKQNAFGIHIKAYCKAHEAWVTSQRPTQALLEAHETQIRWLQHERLVHLIVTELVVFVELFVVDLALLHPKLGLLPPILMLGLAILLGFYFYHYFGPTEKRFPASGF